MNQNILDDLILALSSSQAFINKNKRQNKPIPNTMMVITDKELNDYVRQVADTARLCGAIMSSIMLDLSDKAIQITSAESLAEEVENIDLSNLNYYLVETGSNKAYKHMIDNIHNDFLKYMLDRYSSGSDK